MKTIPGWLRFLLAGVLALGLVGAAGCEDDDDPKAADEAVAQPAGAPDEGTVTTNVVATTNGDGTISLITNLVFNPNPVVNLTLKLPAPKLAGSADGVSWDLQPGAQGATVKFEWEAVTGADGYLLAVQRPGQSSYMETSVAASPAWAQHPRGTNFWKMAAVVGSTPQTWSATRSFIFK